MNNPSLRRLATALEVPDCDCPFQWGKIHKHGCKRRRRCSCPQKLLPCPHVQAADHQLSLDDWACVLMLLDPEGYDEPPLPPAGAIALTHQARVALYEERARLGQSLFHPDDLIRNEMDLKVVPRMINTRNGCHTRTSLEATEEEAA